MLTVYTPAPIGDVFRVTPDQTEWNGEYEINGENMVPVRDNFLADGERLIPISPAVSGFFQNLSQTNYGVYILLFEEYRKFYVGIAARYSYINARGVLVNIIQPEGFLTRLRKHRVKCTGSRANINHTDHNGQGWRNLAMRRWQDHNARREIDIMGDCKISIVNYSDNTPNETHNNRAEHEVNDKGKFEWLEHYIANGHLNEFVGDRYAGYSCFAHTNQPAVHFPGLLVGLEQHPFPFLNAHPVRRIRSVQFAML